MGFLKKDQLPPAPEVPAARPRPETAETQAQRAVPSAIGRNVRITGEISGDEDLLVEGAVEGKINISKTLTIGQAGQIKAEIHGDTVIVMGRVAGDISAAGKVILKPSANVTGNINCASFIVNEGAGFEGNIHMKTPEKPSSRPATPPPPKPEVKSESKP